MDRFASYCYTFNSKVEQACAVAGNEQYRQLVKYIEGDANKTSAVDLKKRKSKIAKGINKSRKITKSEQNNCGIDVPAEMDGGLKIKDF